MGVKIEKLRINLDQKSQFMKKMHLQTTEKVVCNRGMAWKERCMTSKGWGELALGRGAASVERVC